MSCDFDGTITDNDVVQAMLARFAGPAWRTIEAEWEAGLIGSRTCLARQTELLRVSADLLASWVDQQPVDPDVAGFFADCGHLGAEVRIVSDGYDMVIDQVMARLGLQTVPVYANHLLARADDRWAVDFPHGREACSSGTCKCSVVGDGPLRVHIGDGRSDICVAEMCDLVFAKGALLESRTARGLPCVPFNSFAEIRDVMPALMARSPDGGIERSRQAAG